MLAALGEKEDENLVGLAEHLVNERLTIVYKRVVLNAASLFICLRPSENAVGLPQPSDSE